MRMGQIYGEADGQKLVARRSPKFHLFVSVKEPTDKAVLVLRTKDGDFVAPIVFRATIPFEILDAFLVDFENQTVARVKKSHYKLAEGDTCFVS